MERPVGKCKEFIRICQSKLTRRAAQTATSCQTRAHRVTPPVQRDHYLRQVRIRLDFAAQVPHVVADKRGVASSGRILPNLFRSEERRVGKVCTHKWWT